MKFSSTISDINKVLQKIMPVLPPKSTIPVLEHLHVTLEGNTLQLIATDQNITIMSKIEVEGLEDGKVLVPGRKFNEIIGALSNYEGNLEFTTNPENYEIRISEASGNFNLKGLNPEEYLDIPELFEPQKTNFDELREADGTIDSSEPTAFFKNKDIINLCNKTIFAVSNDDFRPAMTGVLFQFRENYVSAVSTDSYRLVKAVVRSEKVAFPQDFDIIIPSKTIELLRKVDNDVVMSVIYQGDKLSHAKFEFGTTTFISKVINEKFPPYETVIPNNNEFIATISRDKFMDAIRVIGRVTSNVSKQIKLALDTNKIIVSGEDEESGSGGVKTLNCEYNGKEIEIGFNFKYLNDALNHVEDDDTIGGMVEMSFSEPNKPALIKPKQDHEDLLMLIMPVRL